MSWIDSYAFDDEFDDFRDNPRAASFWADRIALEVAAGHELHGRAWTVVATWGPQDEAVVRQGEDVALVHLTFTKAPPEHPPYPLTRFFRSAEEFEAFMADR